MGGVANTVGSVIPGAIGGAASGGALGSIVPGVGTVIGAGAGGLLGAGSSLMNHQQGVPVNTGLSAQQQQEQQLNNALMQRSALSDYLLQQGEKYKQIPLA